MTAVRELFLTKLTEKTLVHLDKPGFWFTVRMQGGLLTIAVVVVIGGGGGSACR